MPADIKALRARPTRIRWSNEIKNHGWEGPNGSSLSSDHIMGIRIGNSQKDYVYSDMPANLHDFRYQQGRRLGLPESERKFADKEYRDGCIETIENRLDGRIMISIGIVRCWVRYYALRLFGRAAWGSKKTFGG